MVEPAEPAKPVKQEPIWKQLELLVAKIQRDLAPDAEVLHNVKLKDRDSEQSRQVDVLVRQKIGQYDITIAIDCKDYAQPVDVKGVEEFRGLVADIGANKGAMVAPHKWRVSASIPTLCDFRGASISFSLSESSPGPFRIPLDFWETMGVYDENGKLLGTPVATAINRWNNAEYPTSPGQHNDVPLFPTAKTFVDNGYGKRVPVSLTVSLIVRQQLYLGRLPLVKIRGLKDEHTGGIVTNAFTTGDVSAEEIVQNWLLVESEADAPKSALHIVGLECWELSA